MATLIYDNNELTTRDFRAMATTMGQYMTDNNLIGYTYHTTKKSVIFVDCIGDRKVIPLQEVVN